MRDPLVQFLIAGLVIFGVYSVTRQGDNERTDTITITLAEQKNLAALFRKTWQRPPTQHELDGLVNRRIEEELLYREALALGIARDDVVIRRRLAQKMGFISDDLAARHQPTDEELAAYLAANQDRYAIGRTLSFEQVYLSADQRGPTLQADATAMLAELRRGADPKVLGDPGLLPREMSNAAISDITRTFGAVFADTIKRTSPGEWTGPVRSAFGAHIVRVTGARKRQLRTLDEARSDVLRDWRAAQRRKARDAYHKALRNKYRVVVEAVAKGAQ